MKEPQMRDIRRAWFYRPNYEQLELHVSTKFVDSDGVIRIPWEELENDLPTEEKRALAEAEFRDSIWCEDDVLTSSAISVFAKAITKHGSLAVEELLRKLDPVQ